MSDTNRRKSLEESKTALPLNEDIVDELVKGIDEANIVDTMANKDDTDRNSAGSERSSDDKLGGEQSTSSNVEEKGDSATTKETSEEKAEVEECKDEDEKEETELPEDYIDELQLKDLELNYSEEDKQRLREEADQLKVQGNSQFKTGDFKDAASSYTDALRICPLAYGEYRAVLYANRAAAKMSMNSNEPAIQDCTKAIELDPQYLKAFLRRAKLYESTENLDESLADYNKVLEMDPLHREALFANKRLTESINERNEKLKAEMMGKLKNLGNMFLRPFGLSTNNFQMVQDPNTGGYSINFQQNLNGGS